MLISWGFGCENFNLPLKYFLMLVVQRKVNTTTNTLSSEIAGHWSDVTNVHHNTDICEVHIHQTSFRKFQRKGMYSIKHKVRIAFKSNFFNLKSAYWKVSKMYVHCGQPEPCC